MKSLRFLFCFVFLFLFSFLSAQQSGTHFDYDASGNRTLRNTIVFPARQSAPSRASAVVREYNENDYISNENDSVSITADDFFELETMGMPENNEHLDKFYTDRLNESDVTIYPNPTRGVLAVEIRNKNSQNPHHLMVHSLNGTVVFQRSNIGNYTEIDLSSQPRGLYLMRISSGDLFITWRIIKE